MQRKYWVIESGSGVSLDGLPGEVQYRQNAIGLEQGNLGAMPRKDERDFGASSLGTHTQHSLSYKAEIVTWR